MNSLKECWNKIHELLELMENYQELMQDLDSISGKVIATGGNITATLPTTTGVNWQVTIDIDQFFGFLESEVARLQEELYAVYIRFGEICDRDDRLEGVS